jgi:hypothetical protein
MLERRAVRDVTHEWFHHVAREVSGGVGRLDEDPRPFSTRNEQIDEMAPDEACRAGDQGLHSGPVGSDPDRNAKVVRRSSPIARRQERAVTVINIPVHGCEKRNIAPTPERLTPNIPENTKRPINSLLPRCAGGVGSM